ncbi:MAG: hypothetical protein N2738_06915 [Thermodesulfovibrionales bacterium]|nr:hypothetical protein [Thermodesulfovibrionales bacterium]
MQVKGNNKMLLKDKLEQLSTVINQVLSLYEEVKTELKKLVEQEFGVTVFISPTVDTNNHSLIMEVEICLTNTDIVFDKGKIDKFCKEQLAPLFKDLCCIRVSFIVNKTMTYIMEY